MSFELDEAIKITPDSKDRNTYNANLQSEWCIGQVPHGGYLLSVILNALQVHARMHHADLGQTDPVQLHAAFVIKAQAGPARVVVEEIKIGRGYSNYKAVLQQQDGSTWINLIHTSSVMGSFSKEQGPSLVTTERKIPQRSNCKEVPPVYSEFRRVANKFQYWEPAPHVNPAVQEQWLAFRDRRPMDILAMGLICDLMTPLPLRVLPNERGWYPTLTLDLQFKKAPAAEGQFTYLEVESESIQGGRFDITTRCYDVNHDLIAISKHAALMVSAARNLQKRTSRAKV